MEITSNTQADLQGFTTAVEQEALSNEDFMKLFLTQLQNQDPTKPMDTQSMLDQTMQMSTIEANNTNIKALEQMKNAFSSAQMVSSLDLIGKKIDIGDTSVELAGGASTFSIYFDQNVQEALINIRDVDGNLVGKLDLEALSAGETSFTWDGKDIYGNSVDDGTYYLEVLATNSDNQALKGSVGNSQISSIEFEDGATKVVVNGQKVDLEDVSKVW